SRPCPPSLPTHPHPTRLKPLSLHDALPILSPDEEAGYKIVIRACRSPLIQIVGNAGENGDVVANAILENKNVNYGYDARLSTYRSEEHTSELQSLRHLVCRLLLEKKKKQVQ